MSLESKIMAAARAPGNDCIRCGVIDGTVCGRHLNGLRQHWYGKGRAIKCHPLAVAEFCKRCDVEFQEGSVSKDDPVAQIEYSEEFLHWCLMSNIRRVERGIIG